MVWFQERLRPTDLQVTLIWAGVIGFCGGVSSIAFRVATSIVHRILTGSSEPGLVESFARMPLLLRLIVPAVGGLLAGAILQFGTRLRGRVTTTDYMEAVVLGDGKIAARRTLLKCLSSLFTIASGGSIGREGSAGSTFGTRGFTCRPAPKMVHSTPAIARWLRRSRRDRFGLQCSHCGRSVCRRDRAWLCSHGNFRSPRFFLGHCHIDRARIPRDGPALCDSSVPT